MKKKSGKTYSHSELNDRLMFTQDLFERLGGCPFYPLKSTAWSIHGGKEAVEKRGEVLEGLTGDGIYAGVKEGEWTDQRKSMLNTLTNFLHYDVVENDKGFTIKDKGDKPPVYVTIIKRHYEFFENADITFWGVTEFLMPNSFHNYWKARNLVQ